MGHHGAEKVGGLFFGRDRNPTAGINLEENIFMKKREKENYSKVKGNSNKMMNLHLK